MSATCAPCALAALTVFNSDFAGWQAASGPYSTCDFTGFAQNTLITDQYADLGVLFTNPSPNVVFHSADLFPQDGWGIDPNNFLEVTFTSSIHTIAAHSPTIWGFKLFLGDALVGQVFAANGGAEHFRGVTSDLAFDRARLLTIDGFKMTTDNLYFSTVPGPGAIGLFFLGGLAGSRRRRG